MKGQTSTVETVHQEDEQQYRATFYFLLSKLLSSAPTSEVLAAVSAMSVPEYQTDSRFLKSLNSLAASAAQENNLDVLDEEYHDLFVGLGRGELLPYASWYLTGMLMDKPLSRIREDLKALGIERIQGNLEPEDHVASLFDIMGILITDTSDDYKFKTQQTFFDRHLKPWVGRFFRDLEVARKARFYKEVGRFGSEFVEFETSYLEMPA